MKYFVTVQDRTYEVELEPGGVRVDGQEVDADLARVKGTDVHNLLLDGVSHRLVAHSAGRNRWALHLEGGHLEVEAVDERTHAIRQMTDYHAGPSGPKPVTAPMPGLVVKVEVEPGDRVEQGQGVVIVEAMKMENELKAPAAGIVSAVHVATGDTVAKDQVLVDFEAPEGDGGDGDAAGAGEATDAAEAAGEE